MAQAFEPFDARPGQPRAWLLDKAASGGGPMADFGCHRIQVYKKEADPLGPDDLWPEKTSPFLYTV